MHNSLNKSKNSKRIRVVLSFTMAMVMVFSSAINVFAAINIVTLSGSTPLNNICNGTNYPIGVSFNGDPTTNTNAARTMAPIDTTKLPAYYQSVPVDATFTLDFYLANNDVKLSEYSYDPATNNGITPTPNGGFSTTVHDRDLIQIQEVDDGTTVSGVTVSNKHDTNGTADPTVQVHPTVPLKYGTSYNLVVKKYFTKVNKQGVIKDITQSDVVIPFKTEALPKPTVTKAELRGTTLTLGGLIKNQKLEYNLAADGNFQDANWTAFDYTDDTANIAVSNVNLTANSKIEVGYAKDDNSTPTDVSDPISVSYASVSGPSFTGAVLNGNNLVLNGLPKNAVGIEYSIAADGQNYSDWKDLSVTGTTASVDASGLNLIEGQSIIQVRYKASAPWSASDVTKNSFVYDIGTTVPLTQGKDTIISDGIKISSVNLNTPGTGEANDVTVRDASGEKVAAPAGMTNMGFFYGDNDMVKSAGGIYGFTLKGAGSGDNNHVKITIPYNLPTKPADDVPDYGEYNVFNDSKVAIYMLTPINVGSATEAWQYWKMMPTTIDSVNHTATVDVTGFDTNGKDIILGAKYYVFPPENFFINQDSRTATSITLNIFQGSSVCGTKEIVLQRVNRDDPTDVKTVTLSYKDYPKLLNFAVDNWIEYTDNDPKPGVNYAYTILSVTDMLGNKSCGLDPSTGKVVDNPSEPFNATIDSMETLVKEAQDSIYANLKELQNNLYHKPAISFAPGDSQNSVTQRILLPTRGILAYGASDIVWTSDRPDIIKIGKDGGDTEVHPPVDKDGNPIKDGVTVTLTGTITNYTGKGEGNNIETATGTVTVPLKVKWNISNGEAIIGNEFLHNPNLGSDNSLNFDPTININTAAKFDDSIAKTIVFQHSIILKDKAGSTPQDLAIDGHGKTIKADFDGALFDIPPVNSGSFTLKNVTIDMNHKTGPVLSVHSVGNKITFDNVKIINAENCQYGVLLEAGAQEEQFIANNCQFPSFKVASIAATTSLYSGSCTILDKTYTHKNMPISISIDNCTFDGGGNPGYGILNAFGNISVKNSTFKGYKGAVNTGWNAGNDSDLGQQAPIPKDADGNIFYEYKGIPDGSPSAAILVKELGSANLSGNTITDSDNSVLTWTGEKNFSFLAEKPDAGFVAYPTVNGIKVDSTTAEQVVDSIVNSNTIVGVKDSNSNQVLVQDASDRYNRTTILAKAAASDTTAPTWDVASKVEASKVTENSLTLSWSGASDNVGVTAYNIYKDGTLLGTVDGNTTSYDVAGLNPNTEYTFKVEAVDGGSNVSTTGPSIKAKTLNVKAPTPIGVSYQTHVQNIGWQGEVSGGALSGTEGKSLRLEGIKLNLTGDLPAGAGIKYETHVQNLGWQSEVTNGELSGTEGKGLRLEGIKISLKNMPGYSIQYRVHVQNMGWQDWVSDGQLAGTEGKGLRLEAIEVRVVKVSDTTVGVSYKSQVQNLGWQSDVTNGQLSGTEGQGLRLEGVKINLVNAPAGAAIKYQTHVQNIGWQNEVTNGELSGTEGKGLRLEGIKISLENMPGYKVEYRAHVQNQGWQDWVSDGALAGTEGKGLRIEALEVRIVKINSPT